MALNIKSIRQTFLYSTMNKGSYMDNLIKNIIGKGKVLSYDVLEYEVNTINKYYKYAMKKNVMEAYKAGVLRPVVFPPGIEDRVSAAIPFMLGGSNNGMIAYVFIDNYKSYNSKDDVYSIDPKKLYCMLESAYIALIIQKFFPALSRNAIMGVEGAYVYSHMFTRILNKKYALNVDKRAYTKMIYLSAKFYLVNLLGCDPTAESTNNYAMKVAECDNNFMLMEVDRVFTAECFEDLSKFIQAVSKNAYLISQSLAELTIKEFLTDFVNMYHTSAVFSLEHLAYFMFTIDSVIQGAYLNNQVILEDIVDKSGAKMYTLMANYQI